MSTFEHSTSDNIELKHRIFSDKIDEINDEISSKSIIESDIYDNLLNDSGVNYSKQQQQQTSQVFDFLSQWDIKVLGAITFLAVAIRMAMLNNPGVVIFDEVHFGGFAAKYLRGEFFFDLHPPLARLLVTLAGWLSGFKGDFNFHDIGVDYKRHGVPYVGMRAFSAIFGVATVPLCFLTVRAVGGGPLAALSAGLLVLFENSLVTQSRFILLDSYLVFFTAASLLTYSLFTRINKNNSNHFNTQWWSCLALTGFNLGCAASCKWVGLFTVASVGVQVVWDLWGMWCNTLIPLRKISKSFGARALCLILIPACVYISTFWIHFKILSNYSHTVSSFTIQFQQNFDETRIPATNGPVYFGSTISLRQDRRDNPGYLHSHEAMYPEGSKQQQVTIYHHRDVNNLFVLRRPFVPDVTYSQADLLEAKEEEALINLRHGDKVRLLHVGTGRYLHSHNEVAPVSTKKEHHNEVSCYGHEESRFSDLNDNWIVQIVGRNGQAIAQPENREDSPKINALKDRLIFLHPQAGCVLHSNNKALPEWGFRQGEVTCGREVLKGHTHWKIESNEHPLHPQDSNNFKVEHGRAGFWEMFAELHGRMWVVNAGLDSPHYFQSWPKDWPFLRRGLGFWNGIQIPRAESEIKQSSVDKDVKRHADQIGNSNNVSIEEERIAHEESYKKQSEELKGKQIYLLGNLVTWHGVTLSILTLITLSILSFVIEQRIKLAPGFGSLRLHLNFISGLIKFNDGIMFTLSSWLLHYVPFYLMGRQLFLHHYLPALYCGIMFMCLVLDRILPSKIKLAVFGSIVFGAIGAFIAYAPLAYGTDFKLCKLLKLKSQWDWDCASY